MDNTNSLLLRIGDVLPYGSRAEIAVSLGVSKSLVLKVLKGERKNDEVLRAAENKFLTIGLDSLSFQEFKQVALKIFERRGAKNPHTALMLEVVLHLFNKPFDFDYQALHLN